MSMSDEENSASSPARDFCKVAIPLRFGGPFQTVHFNNTHTIKQSPSPRQHHHKKQSLELEDRSYYTPLDGKISRPFRRRGAAAHSQLLRNAFEASMVTYEDEDDDDEEDGYCYTRNSTMASRDGIEEVLMVPRKRIRKSDSREAARNVLGNFFGEGIVDGTTATSRNAIKSPWQQHRASQQNDLLFKHS